MAKSILVVDDESIVVGITKHKLEDQGYEVQTAENGSEALLSLKSKIPNLIVMDIQMPDMNGYTFIMEKSKTPEYANIPVVVLTAYGDLEPLFKLHGIKAYLLKPLKLQDLINKIVEIVGHP